MLLRITFNRALAISFFWHLFCFFAITIVIIPPDVKTRGFSNISFLGAILDEDSFRRDVGAWQPKPEVTYSRPKRFSLSIKPDRPADKIEVAIEKDYLLNKKPYKDSVGEVLKAEKIRPPLIRGEGPGPVLESHPGTGALGRAIIFKPPAPDCATLVHNLQGDIVEEHFKLKLKATIAPDGTVKLVEKLESCGHLEIDLAGMHYVKKWRFVPLAADVPQDDYEEVVLLELEAK